MGFAEFKHWLTSMSLEERRDYEFSMSPKYIQEYGEEVNEIRLCVNVHKNYTSSEFWFDKVWQRDSNLRFLDNKRFDDWVVNAP